MIKLCLLLLLFAAPAYALDADEQLADPRLELRARELSTQIRCLVCEGEAIDQSNADFAIALRRVIRQQLTSGADDAAIKSYLVERYGQAILMRPNWSDSGMIVWLAPILLLAMGGFAVFWQIKRTK